MPRVVGALALGAVAGLAAAACSDPVEAGGGFSVAAAADDPIDFGTIPDFRLTSQTGEEVSRATLAGRPFVLAAIFTRCTGPCPAITANMRRLQGMLAGTDARLVTVSVDPTHDSPEVLASYAEAWGADAERWVFLTGPEEAVHELVRVGFSMAVDRSTDDAVPAGRLVTHDTRLVAVDHRGRKRGWYDGKSDAGLALVRDRMRFLAQEAAGGR